MSTEEKSSQDSVERAQKQARAAIASALMPLPSQLRMPLTWDQGLEMPRYRRLRHEAGLRQALRTEAHVTTLSVSPVEIRPKPTSLTGFGATHSLAPAEPQRIAASLCETTA